jgi:hypothetical protein
MFVIVAVSRFALNGLKVKKGVMLMKNRLTVLFTFTGVAEMVWDIGAKVIGASRFNSPAPGLSIPSGATTWQVGSYGFIQIE